MEKKGKREKNPKEIKRGNGQMWEGGGGGFVCDEQNAAPHNHTKLAPHSTCSARLLTTYADMTFTIFSLPTLQKNKKGRFAFLWRPGKKVCFKTYISFGNKRYGIVRTSDLPRIFYFQYQITSQKKFRNLTKMTHPLTAELHQYTLIYVYTVYVYIKWRLVYLQTGR